MNKNGVFQGEEEKVVTRLKEAVGIHIGLLRFPTYVLSEAASKKTSKIIINSPKGKFSVSSNKQLPTAKHSIYFDLFCCMFASNWNPKGIVHFRFSDLLKMGGKHPKCKHSRQSSIETIRRYMDAHFKWENTFETSSTSDIDWSGPLIVECNVINDKGEVNIKQIGAIKNQDQWNHIRIHPVLVDALDPNNDPRTRIFLTETFKRKLKLSESIVYRYFYGHWDSDIVWKSLKHGQNGLINSFNWTGQKSKFLPWITKALDGLIKQGLVTSYELRNDKTAIAVITKNIKDIHHKKTKSMNRNVTKKSITPTKAIKTQNIFNENIWREYQKRKVLGVVKEDHMLAIDAVWNNAASKSMAIDMIKNYVLKDEKSIN